MTEVQNQSKRFEFDLPLSQREVVYSNAQEAVYSPLAKKLFGFPWTEKVIIGPRSVEVQKASWVDWDVLEGPLEGLIKEHIQAKAVKGALEENPEPPKMGQEFTDEVSLGVQKLLEETLNPALAQHGGSVRLVEVRDKQAMVMFEGGCQGCAMSAATLQQGVERAILSSFPQIESVVDVTDHLSGENPYYTT